MFPSLSRFVASLRKTRLSSSLRRDRRVRPGLELLEARLAMSTIMMGMANPADAVTLNPQPLPPKVITGGAILAAAGSLGDTVTLNPQPLPPKVSLGVAPVDSFMQQLSGPASFITPGPQMLLAAPGDVAPATDLNQMVLDAAQGLTANLNVLPDSWTLVDQALQAAGADTSGDANFVFGTPIALSDITPGDVLQFEAAHFEHIDPVTGELTTCDFPHGTAIVGAVNGSVVTLLTPPVDGGVAPQVLITIDLNELTSGDVFAYRPQVAEPPAPDPNPPPADPAPVASINDKVLSFAKDHLHTQVGNGDCWTLVDQALRAAGADTRGDAGYVFGATIPLSQVAPGDVLQFENVHFKHVDAHSWYTQEFPHHTAIVASVDGSKITLLNQNVNGDRTVQYTTIDMADFVDGTITAYHPQPA